MTLAVYTNEGKFDLEFKTLDGIIKSEYDEEIISEDGCLFWKNAEPFKPPFNGWLILSKEKNKMDAFPIIEKYMPFDVKISGIYEINKLKNSTSKMQ